MSGFINWLESLGARETKVRALLRRSLAFPPGTHAPAYPYVEPFVTEEDNAWRREVYYLVAGLWAAHWREGRTGPYVPIGKACAAYQKTTGSTSTERRFINLLDADREQLPHRLRQVIALLKDQAVDFEELLTGLLFWRSERKRTQNAWARDFYRSLMTEMPPTEDQKTGIKETQS